MSFSPNSVLLSQEQVEREAQRAELTRLKELEAEDRLLAAVQKLRDRITKYSCPTDSSGGDRPSGHLLAPLKQAVHEGVDMGRPAGIQPGVQAGATLSGVH